MMNALKGGVSSDLDELVHWTDSPFIALVTSFPLPLKFRMPQVETYDGSKDPLDHLESFKTLVHLQGVVDEIMCQAFPTMLKSPARLWFSRLTSNYISTFKELSAQFSSHFIGGIGRYKKYTACLMSINRGRKKRCVVFLQWLTTRYQWRPFLVFPLFSLMYLSPKNCQPPPLFPLVFIYRLPLVGVS